MLSSRITPFDPVRDFLPSGKRERTAEQPQSGRSKAQMARFSGKVLNCVLPIGTSVFRYIREDQFTNIIPSHLPLIDPELSLH
jgi:hypothetical protein